MGWRLASLRRCHRMPPPFHLLPGVTPGNSPKEPPVQHTAGRQGKPGNIRARQRSHPRRHVCPAASPHPMNLRTRLACCLLAAALVLTLFVSAPGTGGVSVPPWDKFAHLGFYGAVAVLLTIALGPRRWVIAIAIVCLIGVADESYQSLLPGRHADWGDLAADFFAAGGGRDPVRAGGYCAALPELPLAGHEHPDGQQQVGQGVRRDRHPRLPVRR